jgi:hypothetical protein
MTDVNLKFQLALTYPQWIRYLDDDVQVERLLDYLLDVRSETYMPC